MTLQQLTSEEFQAFQELIYAHSGIDVPENKVMLLSNRVRRRVRACGLGSFDAYLALLKTRAGQSELEALLDAVTTNETSFFRTEKHFQWLQTEFIEDLRARVKAGRHPKSIRLWSAACSTGQEPYSIAIALAECTPRLSDWSIQIDASDISETALEQARQARYKFEDLKGLSESQISRYFNTSSDRQTCELKTTLREQVRIYKHNLLKPHPEGNFDCIFIRNVLIYFDRESKQKVIRHLISALADGGYLVVGPSEGIYDMLAPLEKRAPLLYQKPASGGSP